MNKFLDFYRLANSFLLKNIFTVILLSGIILWNFPGKNEPLPFYGDFAEEIASLEKEAASFEINKPLLARSSSKKASNLILTTFAKVDYAKIVKKAYLELEVSDTEKAKNKVNKIAKEYNAYLSSLNSYEVRSGVLSYNFVLKVPSQKLEKILEKLNTLGSKKRDDYSLTDITQQYSDTDAKIKNLKTRRDRLRGLLEFKTKNLNDVLNVDRALSRVQLEIDNLTRNQLSRDNDVKFSTVNLTLNPEPQLGDSSQKNWSLERSWKVSINSFLDTIKQIIDIIILTIAYLPIIALIIFIIFLIKRRLLNKRNIK